MLVECHIKSLDGKEKTLLGIVRKARHWPSLALTTLHLIGPDSWYRRKSEFTPFKSLAHFPQVRTLVLDYSFTPESIRQLLSICPPSPTFAS